MKMMGWVDAALVQQDLVGLAAMMEDVAKKHMINLSIFFHKNFRKKLTLTPI